MKIKFFSVFIIQSIAWSLSLCIQTLTYGEDKTNIRGKQLFAMCSSCHGQNGHGNHDLLSPSIAGLPEWYLINQLRKFRSGKRGAHPDDYAGLKMHPIARILDADTLVQNKSKGTWKYTGEKEILAISEFISKLPSKQPKDIIKGGDPVKGKVIYMSCMGCHGQNLEGNEALLAPPQVYMEDWYMLEQLKKFRDGIRGNEKLDQYDPTSKIYISAAQAMAMRGIVKVSVSTEDKMKNVIAYIRELGAKKASTGLNTRGKKLGSIQLPIPKNRAPKDEHNSTSKPEKK